MSDYFPFIDKRLVVRKAGDLGLGIFAVENIESGIFVEIAPVIKCSTNAVSLDPEVFKYVIAWNEGLAIALGWTMFYNHSDNNNCEFSINVHDGLLAIMTVREILKGEQMTVNYGPDWFSSRGIEKAKI
jgi:SET domain-containing protein